MNDNLPPGWTLASVAEVIDDFQAGFASGEKNVPNGIAHLRMNNIGSRGEINLDLLRKVPAKLVKPHHSLKPGDVLVCTTNSSKLVGKSAYFDLIGQYVFSNHLTRLRPNPRIIDGEFLRWSLWMHWKRGTFEEKCKHWVNQSTLPKEALLETKLEVPPLAEQRRIVAKLEVLLGRVDSTRKRLERIPALLKRFRQSVLAAAFCGRLIGYSSDDTFGRSDFPAAWELRRLDSLFSVRTGGTPSRKVREYYDNGTIPWVKTSEVQNSDITKTEEFITEAGVNNSNAKVFPAGTILVAMYGEGRTRGQIGRLTFPAATNQACAALINTELPRETSEYIFYYLLSQYYQLRAESVGGNQPNLNLGVIKSWQVPFPPLTEQREIVSRVGSLFALADRIEGRYAKARAHVEKLAQSILAKAFRGELAPTEQPLRSSGLCLANAH